MQHFFSKGWYKSRIYFDKILNVALPRWFLVTDTTISAMTKELRNVPKNKEWTCVIEKCQSCWEKYTWSTLVYSCHVLNKIASKIYPSQFKHPFQTTFNEKIRLLRIYTNYYWYRLTFMSKNIPVNKLNFITKK